MTLAELKEKNLYRQLRSGERHGAYIEMEGRKYLNFASNDYLGVSARLDWQEEFLGEFLDFARGQETFLMSAGGSRLLGGTAPVFEAFERQVGEAYGRACLFFNCGYHANTGVLPALFGKRDLVVADKLVHASLLDAMRLSDAKWLRYAHNDLDHLRKILARERANYDRVCIVTESIFSMEGDHSDLRGLVEIKKEFDAMLYVDEAHSAGVYGHDGLGLCHAKGVLDDVDIVLLTWGKGWGGEGACILCNEPTRELLINRCRPFIFTTAIAPINILWASFVFERRGVLESLRECLHRHTRTFRECLHKLRLLGDTHIVPVVVGENETALTLSERLLEMGIYAPAVRHPTVPLHSARIRFSLSAALTEEEVGRVIEILNLLE